MRNEMQGNGPANPSAAGAGLVLPFGPHVRQIDYDQFQRYSIVAQRLDQMLGHIVDRPVRILEVGPNVLNLLPRFLDPARIAVTRCDIMRPEDDGDDFVLIEKNKPLPFADGEFDAVVALEVLEHVPGPQRQAFISECVRVASQGTILTCPNGVPEVAECERVAREAYWSRHRAAHPFLSEHVEFGLPREEEVCAILRGLDRPHAVLDNAPLTTWMAMILLYENLVERGASPGLQLRLRTLVTEGASRGCAIPYRKIYICTKSAAAAAALQPAGTGCLPVQAAFDAGDGGQLAHQQVPSTPAALHASTNKVAGMLDRLQQEFIRAARTLRASRSHAATGDVLRRLQLELVAASESVRGLRFDLHAGRESLESLHACPTATGAPPRRLKAAVDWLRYVWWRIVSTKLARLSRFIESKRYDTVDLLPLNQVQAEDKPGCWTATGTAAQFVIPCDLKPGAVRLRMRMRSEQPGRVHVVLDRDARFDGGERIELARIHGPLDLERYLCLDRPVSAVRFDAIDQPGQIFIEKCVLEQPAEWRALLKAFRAKVAAARQRGALGSMLKTAVRTLLSGDFAALRQKCLRGLETNKPANRNPALAYKIWREQHRLTAADRQRMRAEAERLTDAPLISLLLPVRDGSAVHLRGAISSVVSQMYRSWELCVAAPESIKPELRRLLDEFAHKDVRIKVAYHTRLDTDAAACNAALEAARGSHVALLKPDDALAEQALFEVARVIVREPDVDMLYSDEDQLDANQEHSEPFFKPDWSPEYLLACMYTQNLGVYRTALVRELNGFRPEFDTAHEYDLALRISGQSQRIRHIPDILYHRRAALRPAAVNTANDPRSHSAARRTLESHLRATRRAAAVESGPIVGLHRVRFALKNRPRVSIIIPTGCGETTVGREKSWFVLRCVESICRKSRYADYEIIVLDNNDMPPALAKALKPFPIRRISFTEPFNLAAKMNLGAKHATGEHLIFLNDDIEAVSPDWIECLLEFSQQRDIGAVGAKLLFPDGRLQHVGVTILAGNPGHPYYRFPQEHQGYFMGNVVHRNYSAVTGACLMTRADVFRSLGGFDVGFPLNYNDVDYCLRVRESGRRIVYTPYAVLLHHESVTKSGTTADELANFKKKWGAALALDPYYNPNLSMSDADYSIGLSYAA